jgi:dipeptidase E
MKLYLSSYRLPTPSDFENLIGMTARDISIALIPNSKDYYSERARNIKIQTLVNDFNALGFSTSIVDLREYNDLETLKNKLTEFDAVWACGGNTFCLRYEMKRSGFDQIILDLVKNGLVFCGDSAGAIVAGPTLKGSESADNPEFAEEIIWDGLGLIPDFIMPHVNSEAYKDTLEIVRSLHANDSNYVELNDWEAAIYKDGQKTIVSSKT